MHVSSFQPGYCRHAVACPTSRIASVEAIPVAPIDPTKPELLLPLPFWQYLERENLRRPLGVLATGRLVDVMA